MPEHRIQLTNVTKRFRKPDGGVYTALRDLSMTVAPGEFCAVVGPTGCGKSTTLSLVSGLEPASAGTVHIDGVPGTGIDPRVGFMLQIDAAFPWKSVLANVAAGPLFRGRPRKAVLGEALDGVRRGGLAGV